MKVPITYKGVTFTHTIDELGIVRNKHNKKMKMRDTGTRAVVVLYKKGNTYTIGVAALVRDQFRPDIRGKIGYVNSNHMDCNALNLCEVRDIKLKIKALKATLLLTEAEIARALKVSRQYVNQV